MWKNKLWTVSAPRSTHHWSTRASEAPMLGPHIQMSLWNRSSQQQPVEILIAFSLLSGMIM